ncbi:hypothetical protein J4207_04230 [Candidatus Woesearchaeota archaeon]|nr:hypothetical protein [Candidatus Woesearchaeota archaeon]HLC80668.1 hypothetical protein [Candidatus Nanoarchaeia archaeon]
MNRKAAIELSMNFLVVIIISLVILAGGVSLLYKFIKVGKDSIVLIDDQTRVQLEQLLDDGSLVALPYVAKTIKRGNDFVFGLGVLNIKAGGKLTFTTIIKQSKGAGELPVLYDSIPFALEKNQKHTQGILISVPKNAPSGTYIFDVKVLIEGEDDPYGGVKKITVTVP